MSQTPNVVQLADGDAFFLSAETPASSGHIGGLCILDPASHPEFGFERAVRILSERLKLVPRFTWKLQEVPFGLDRPYWVADESFDIRNHVHRMAVPAPGGIRELSKLAALLHERPLDRTLPLWEMWWIEGVEGGRVAVLIKTHHCLIDGEAGVGLAEVLMDTSPDASTSPLAPEAMDEPSPTAPSALEMAQRAAANALGRPLRLAHHAERAARTALQSLTSAEPEEAAATPSEVPRLPFNATLGPRRGFASSSISLERVRELKKHFDVTVNDLLLELVGSALRRHYRAEGALSDTPLVALCPVSMREEGDKRLNNQVTTMAVPLATHREDPVRRLREIHHAARAAKSGVERGQFDILGALGEVLAPVGLQQLMRVSQAVGERLPLPGNFVFSNVRGAPIPIYLAGAKVDRMFPLSLLSVAQGLNVTAVSYLDQIHFGFLVDPALVPDPWALAEGITQALSELEAAAEGVRHRTA